MATRLGVGLVVLASIVVLGGVVACGAATGRRGPPDRSSTTLPAALPANVLRGLDDPTVRGARLIPASLEEARTWGVEPGGGARLVVAGLRVVSSPSGEIVAAVDRLSSNPSSVVDLPERLGGGFILAVGPHVWRSPTWLGTAVPIFTLGAPIAEVLVGLDRVYVRAAQGPLVALDPRTGASLDLGPMPPSPRVVSIAALDAWRAMVVADLRGALVTIDAGSSWRPIPLAMEPSRVVASNDAFVVGGFDGARASQWWEVLPEGPASRLASPPLAPPRTGVGGERGEHARLGLSASLLPLGMPPLQAAIEDGWPLTDGTALLARDGAAVRVRLADGAIVETLPDAFALKPARCHPLSLARSDERGAFGFVCGEPRGSTVVLRWDPPSSRLVELRRFDSPREVLAYGNGAIAVRGPCAAAAAAGSGAFCVRGTAGVWSELHVSGEGVDRARFVALSSGGIALVRPPEAGDLSTARLTLLDSASDAATARDVRLRIPPSAPEVVRTLRWGVWMDGFEERRPGVLGGWVDAGGSLLGVEIALGGEVQIGESIRDAGAPVVSGRWGFGWTASGSGFETTDGGMTWAKEVALPDPIAEPRVGRERACGPIGCVLAGWLRLGWGAVDTPAVVEPPPPRPRGTRRSPNLTIECDPVGARPALAPAALVTGAARSLAHGLVWGSGAAQVSAFRPFAGHAVAAIPAGELGLSVGVPHLLDRGSRGRSLARVDTWGPSTGDWDTTGRWQVRWLWPWQDPYDSGPETRATAIGPAPWPSLDVATRMLTGTLGMPPEWTLVPGDDADHALLLERRPGVSSFGAGGTLLLLETLESDRAPVEVHPAGPEAWPDFQGAVRAGGRWYVATSQSAGEPAAVVVWLLDGGVAREMGRVPRVAPELSGPVRLVRRATDPGAAPAIGLLATGPDSDRSDRGPSFWVSAFDAEARVFGDPEFLAPIDLSDRGVAPCTGDDGGWEIEAAFPGNVEVHVGPAWSSRLQGVLARLRVWRAGACVDDVFASAGSQGMSADDAIASAPSAGQSGAARTAHVFGATVVTERAYAHLRCRLRTP